MLVQLLCLLLLSQWVVSEKEPLKIGGIFYEEDGLELQAAFSTTAQLYNFTISVKEVSKRGEILEISNHVCALAEEGVIGIIDVTGGRATEHVQALCDMLELPHVTVQDNDLYSRNWSLLNLNPSPEAFNQVLEDLLTLKEWNNFTILYVKGYSTNRVKQLLQMGNATDRYTVSVRELTGDDYRDVLTNAKESGYYNFVVDCPSRNLELLLTHAQQVGLMADEHSYVFVSPDLFTLDLDRYRYGGVNMTGFRLINLATNDENNLLWDFSKQLNEALLSLPYNPEFSPEIAPEQLKTQVVLVHDAVKVFYEGVKKMKDVQPESLKCENFESWTQGTSLFNFMRTNRVEGVTRTIMFDGYGQRTDVDLDLLELTPAGNQTVGTWKLNTLTISRPYALEAGGIEDSIMRNKTFKVLIALTPPYAFMKESSKKLVGNDQYEGFAVDLIDRLSVILGYNYEFEVEPTYGSFDLVTKKSTGMVLKLREDKADFAICDFTISAERQAAIEFSTPFMTLGIGILYKEPSKQPPAMFSFMEVFSKEVWYYMLFVQLGVGVIMIIVGRLSYKEWQNPVPCVEQPEELSNQFSFANSVWLIIGSVMQQGSEIAPIALAPRIITSVWWFFTMVMVASYVGTLVAFLIVEKDVLPFETLQELADHKSIMYGAKNEGSTISFFRNSTNELNLRMYHKMFDKHWLVGSNDEGVAMAENSTYAFFTESTSIDYYKERHCDLLQIGGLLDSKSYGIGMKKKSPYKKYIDDALLKLKERGELQKIKDLWWKEKKGGGKCGEKRDEEQKQLTMRNMLGAFVVLGVGCLIGLFISIMDMLWGVFKRTVKYNTTFKYELIEELKFALSFSGDIKPVKRPSMSAKGSMEMLAAEAEAATKEEEKDELASLRSACTFRSGRSAKSSSTHRSNHSSRHSSCSLSVAFARRRKYS